MISVQHPTERPNFYIVTVGPDMEFFYSYQTIIAYRTHAEGLVISENNWTRTTGKHLNWISDDKKRRIPYSEFQVLLARLTGIVYAAVNAAIYETAHPTPEEIDNAVNTLRRTLIEINETGVPA